ncbi:MAG: tRNA pseudouridine(38-40) synthase TruA [Anaerolineae bacterium]|nr:tRNA pseudouridine(38-40) synthase TruA [Anaerolineae bacterium]
MTRYRAILAYDGTAYQGFQRQNDAPTIQLMLENAIQKVTGQLVTVIGAGRTDTGVHATGQVVAFDVDWAHDDESLLRALNFHLPDDIALQDIRQHDGFHPRYDALARRYVYTVIHTPHRHPLYRHSAWHLYGELSLGALQTVAPMLIGERDFKAFGHDPMKRDNTVREVFVSEWSSTPITDGVLLRYTVEANAFLYHMVRRMVSAQIAVGRGMMSIDEFTHILAIGDMGKIRQIAPSHGLVLEKVRYSDDNN